MMTTAIHLLLIGAPLALGFQLVETGAGAQQDSKSDLDELVLVAETGKLDNLRTDTMAMVDEISAEQSKTLALATVDEISAELSVHPAAPKSAANATAAAPRPSGGLSLLGYLNKTARERLVKLAGSDPDNLTALIQMIAPQSVDGRPRLVPPAHLRNKGASKPRAPMASHTASLFEMQSGGGNSGKDKGRGKGKGKEKGQGLREKGQGLLKEKSQEMGGREKGAAAGTEKGRGKEKGKGQKKSEFEADGGYEILQELADQAESSADLPWGVGSPRTGDSLPVFHYSAMPAMDVPKEWEYSLDSGDNIQTFSNAQQDVKLITQIFENVTNGFFLDSNGGNGEHPSNTLLLELAGWRGLVIEPRGFQYLTLWEKMRKAWLFLGCISPNENSTKIGFDIDGNIDMLSGHVIHAHPVISFMAEMGGRKTIDFWNLHSGGYEAEILNETLLGSGKSLEFGVILVRFDGRRTGRGEESFVQMRSRDATEEIVFEILHNASMTYIGGLDAYWINHVSPRFHYKDSIWVNPRYFEKRGIPTPTTIKAAPPPPLSWPRHDLDGKDWTGFPTWDFGYNTTEEIKRVTAYFHKSRADGAAKEVIPKAHRVNSITKLVY